MSINFEDYTARLNAMYKEQTKLIDEFLDLTEIISVTKNYSRVDELKAIQVKINRINNEIKEFKKYNVIVVSGDTKHNS